MSDQPTSGEWTVEPFTETFPSTDFEGRPFLIPHTYKVVCGSKIICTSPFKESAEGIADAHNAALAASQHRVNSIIRDYDNHLEAYKQKSESMLDTSKRVNDKLRQQLAAEREKREKLLELSRETERLANIEIKQLREQVQELEKRLSKYEH